MDEKYRGIKFNVNFLEKKTITHTQLDELKKWCAIFDEMNFAPKTDAGSGGNLSFRLHPFKNEFIITGTQVGLRKNMKDDDFVHVINADYNSELINVKGVCLPSSESMLHYSIYKKYKNINAIFHGHSPMLLQQAKLLNLKTTKEEAEYGSLHLIKTIFDIFNNTTYFYIIKNHGFLSVNESMEKAGEKTLEIAKKCT